jgi:chitinase
MKHLFKLLFLLLLLSVSAASAQDEAAPYRVVGYYSSWSIYARGYMVTDIPADQLTHINYAFINVSEEGECILGDEWADVQFPYPGDPEGEALLGNFRQLGLLKEAHPGLKVLLSVGGWTWSDHFSDLVLTAESRATFAASCVALMKQYNFDGLDIDWEYPVGGGEPGNGERPEDEANFTLLLAELRAQLDTLGAADDTHYLLTIASAAGPQTYQNYELDKIHLYLDWINIMAYDFAGGWSAVTNFQSALYQAPDSPEPLSADAAVQDYLAAGIPADKIVLGVPFYGRAWSGVEAENDGLYQPYSETYGDNGYVSYSDMLLVMPVMQRHWDEAAGAVWLYEPNSGLVITYDDQEVLQMKADYVKANGLGGIMAWELSNDDRDHSLLDAVFSSLNGDSAE